MGQWERVRYKRVRVRAYMWLVENDPLMTDAVVGLEIFNFLSISRENQVIELRNAYIEFNSIKQPLLIISQHLYRFFFKAKLPISNWFCIFH